MHHEVIDGVIFKKMLLAAASHLEANKASVDALNVFPVPDGDTGTNMSLTLQAAGREVGKTDSVNIAEVAAAVSMGSLMGARGNSGVILSQIFRGISRGLEGKRRATGLDLAWALQGGVDTAYKAVMKPVEGTILTVARETARAALARAREGAGLVTIMEAAVAQAEATLAKTPQMLPVLRQAGVVDAGGKGLVFILKAWLMVARGQELVDELPAAPPPSELQMRESFITAEMGDIHFIYDTVFMLRGTRLPVDGIRQYLDSIGDSLVVVGDETLIKVHVHTNTPGKALEYCLQHGELLTVQIENMKEQHAALTGGQDLLDPPSGPMEKKAQAIVSVGVGDGLIEVLRSLGADAIVEGGQTMNPSTEEIVQAVEAVPSDKVIILPNNKNIILAAEQTRELTQKEVAVVPTRNVSQGIAALLAFDPEAELSENVGRMAEAGQRVRHGEVTFAVRDTQLHGREIKKGDIIGIVDGRIEAVGSEPTSVARELVGKMVSEETEIITLFYGQEVTPEAARAFGHVLAEDHPRYEIELHQGGQPLYYFFISVE